MLLQHEAMLLKKKPEKLFCSSGYSLVLVLLVFLRPLGCVKRQGQQNKHHNGYNDSSGIHDELGLNETMKMAQRPQVIVLG